MDRGSVLPVCLSALAFDLCLTAGPGVDGLVGSCGHLISPVLTQTQLIDSTLWYSATKLSDKSLDRNPSSITHSGPGDLLLIVCLL